MRWFCATTDVDRFVFGWRETLGFQSKNLLVSRSPDLSSRFLRKENLQAKQRSLRDNLECAKMFVISANRPLSNLSLKPPSSWLDDLYSSLVLLNNVESRVEFDTSNIVNGRESLEEWLSLLDFFICKSTGQCFLPIKILGDEKYNLFKKDFESNERQQWSTLSEQSKGTGPTSSKLKGAKASSRRKMRLFPLIPPPK